MLFFVHIDVSKGFDVPGAATPTGALPEKKKKEHVQNKNKKPEQYIKIVHTKEHYIIATIVRKKKAKTSSIQK